MATINIEELILGPDSYNEFNPSDTYVIATFTTGTWSGTSGHPTVWRSSTPGSQVTIQIPEAITVSYADFQDINFTGYSVNAKDRTSTNSGNNNGILWPTGGNNIFGDNLSQLFIEYGVM